jgi:hypothetical protein
MKLGCELFKNQRYFVPVLKLDSILRLGYADPILFYGRSMMAKAG